MANGRRRGRRFSQRQTRKFVWAREDMPGTIVAASSVAFVPLLTDFQAEYGANLIGATVMRLRGAMEFEPAAAATAVSAAGVIVSTQAQVAQIASTADAAGPLSDQHADWMAYEPLLFNDNDPTRQVHRWLVDVKSNRKLEELGQELYLVVENPFGATAIEFRGIVSVGLKLP